MSTRWPSRRMFSASDSPAIPEPMTIDVGARWSTRVPARPGAVGMTSGPARTLIAATQPACCRSVGCAPTRAATSSRAGPAAGAGPRSSDRSARRSRASARPERSSSSTAPTIGLGGPAEVGGGHAGGQRAGDRRGQSRARLGDRYRLRLDRASPSGSRTVGTPWTRTARSRSATIRRTSDQLLVVLLAEERRLRAGSAASSLSTTVSTPEKCPGRTAPSRTDAERPGVDPDLRARRPGRARRAAGTKTRSTSSARTARGRPADRAGSAPRSSPAAELQRVDEDGDGDVARRAHLAAGRPDQRRRGPRAARPW